jgi:putative membrane protein insertion efficiency factor
VNSTCVQEQWQAGGVVGNPNLVDGADKDSSRMARWAIAAIRAYQAARAGRPTGCRYLPTCSEYGIEAIERHGTIRGSMLTMRRLARCTPWGGHGVDPVPEGRIPCSHR